MYYQSYEDYMRDVLGYPRDNQFSTYNYNMQQKHNAYNTMCHNDEYIISFFLQYRLK